MKRLLLLGLVLLAPLAHGADVKLSWVHPTQYIDGKPLPVADIKETKVSWGRSSTGPFTEGSVTVPAPATTTTVPNMICGQYFFVAQTVVKTSESSDNSAPAVAYSTNVSCTKPNPPTAVSATEAGS